MSDEENRTVYVGNLGNEVTEELIYELFLQAGPVEHVKIPFDKVSKRIKNFGFVCFRDEESVPYATYLLDNIKLCGKYLSVQPRKKDMVLPPAACVGVHTLDPVKGVTEGSKLASIPGNYMLHSSPLISNTPCSSFNADPVPHNFGLNYNRNFTVSTNSLNDFKSMYDSYNRHQGNFACNKLQFATDTNSLNDFKNMYNNYNSYSRNQGNKGYSNSYEQDYNTSYQQMNFRHNERRQNHDNYRQDCFPYRTNSNIHSRLGIKKDYHSNDNYQHDDRSRNHYDTQKHSSSRHNNNYDKRSNKSDSYSSNDHYRKSSSSRHDDKHRNSKNHNHSHSSRRTHSEH